MSYSGGGGLKGRTQIWHSQKAVPSYQILKGTICTQETKTYLLIICWVDICTGNVGSTEDWAAMMLPRQVAATPCPRVSFNAAATIKKTPYMETPMGSCKHQTASKSRQAKGVWGEPKVTRLICKVPEYESHFHTSHVASGSSEEASCRSPPKRKTEGLPRLDLSLSCKKEQSSFLPAVPFSWHSQ